MPRLPAAVLPLPLVLALAACSGLGSPGRELAFADVQAVQTGLTASQVLDAYGQPASVARAPDGRVRTMEYAAQDARGSGGRLVLEFDEREVLVRKRYSGAVLRPR